MRASHFGFVLLSIAAGVIAAVACGHDDGAPASSSVDGGGNGGNGGAGGSYDATLEGASPIDAANPPMRAAFGLDSRPANPTCLAPARPPTSVAVKFNPVFASVTLQSPMMMRQIPGDTSAQRRMFVAQRSGTIVSFSATTPPTGAPTTVLTVPNPVSTDGEGGLLGFAFHPKFAQNGRIFFSYTATDAAVSGSNMRSVIARMDSADGGATFANYTELVTFDQTTATNHKGGSIAIGPDGYLYFGFGDGGGGGDTYIHGQLKDLYFAKIHRIDVDSVPPPGKTYAVPASNPFASGGGQASTYAYGIRNPFRFSFDRVAGDLWLGDVGQDLWEEVDRIVSPGANLGWSCREGANDFAITDTARCPNPKAGFLEPVIEYPHSGAAKAVIGGSVYRGKALPSVVGTYIFGDEVTGEIWSLTYDPVTGVPGMTQLNAQGPNGNWVHFAEDEDGELYVVDLNGKIYEMVANPTATDAGAPAVSFPDKLSKTGCVDPKNPTNPVAGLVPYSVQSPLWSDGAMKERWLAVPDTKKIAIGPDGHFDLPIGSVLMKTFSLGGKRIETRLLAHHDDGGWAGYTYEWDDAETDATLLPSSKSKTVAGQSWYYP